MVTFLKKFLAEEEGATAPEYALMVALIAVVMIVTVTALGQSISDKFQEVADGIIGAS